MRVLKSLVALVLSLQLVAPGASAAQQHVTSREVLESMAAQASARDDSARAAIREVLQREEVRRVAADVGLSVAHAEQAVAMLTGAELEEVAAHARQINQNLAGGASTVVISTTTVIIILLLVLLIIVAVD
jgi:hypothetical protein